MFPKTVEPSSEAKKKLTTCRIDLVRQVPFIAFLVMETEVFFTTEIPTMAATTINGNKIFINEDFVNILNREELAFVFLHEVLHLFLEHIGRQTEMNYDGQVWNIATDYCINAYIKGFNNRHIVMPDMGLYDKKYNGMSADEIYHKILEEYDGDADKAAQQYGCPSDGEVGPFDELSRTPMTEQQKTENRQKLSASVANLSESDIKDMGDGVSDLIRAIRELIDPKLDWRTVLADYIVQTTRNRYSYNRASRKSYGSRIIFPTLTGENIDVVFGIDTSGSMSQDDLNEAATELNSIINQFDDWRVTLVSCDTHATENGTYESEYGDDFSSIDMDLIGGGGTDMAPIVEYANQLDDEPSAIIIVTDGYIPEDTLDNAIEDIPVIVVVTESGNDQLKLNNAIVVQMRNY